LKTLVATNHANDGHLEYRREPGGTRRGRACFGGIEMCDDTSAIRPSFRSRIETVFAASLLGGHPRGKG
jgi:hypothetical protein|tara:strand:- start:598 stop:804 length:207 start_codon:yes stop_codon:yes gene_type:complete